MSKKRSEVFDVVKEVLIGMTAALILEELAVILFIDGSAAEWSRFKITIVLGLLAGFLTGVGMFLHMRMSIEESLAYGNASDVSKHMTKSYAIRMIAVMLAMILAFYTGWINILAMLFGTLNLKVGVYLKPFIHRAFIKNQSDAAEGESIAEKQ